MGRGWLFDSADRIPPSRLAHAKSDASDLANVNSEIGQTRFRLAHEPTSPTRGEVTGASRQVDVKHPAQYSSFHLPFAISTMWNADVSRPMWSVGERLKMPSVPTTFFRFSIASRTLALSVEPACFTAVT